MLIPFPEKTRHQLIRDALAELGGSATTRQLAQHCIESGIWSSDEIESFAIREAQKQVRDALGELDFAGLPYAGRTTDKDEETGAGLWKARQLWLFDDYSKNVAESDQRIAAEKRKRNGLVDECIAKFGMHPLHTATAAD